ncbi:hypothetical protein [Aliivibrio sifiae]|uniref:hypothetical protein n=1 Tax=Aliivibrio sifiae TaxID=566293 RepID=UPI003D14129A
MGSFLENMERLQAERKEQLIEIEYLQQKDYPEELDSKFLTRCNSELKGSFEKLCKENKVNVSLAIRSLMENSIRTWSLPK